MERSGHPHLSSIGKVSALTLRIALLLRPCYLFVSTALLALSLLGKTFPAILRQTIPLEKL